MLGHVVMISGPVQPLTWAIAPGNELTGPSLGAHATAGAGVDDAGEEGAAQRQVALAYETNEPVTARHSNCICHCRGRVVGGARVAGKFGGISKSSFEFWERKNERPSGGWRLFRVVVAAA